MQIKAQILRNAGLAGLAALALFPGFSCSQSRRAAGDKIVLLNVSYDPTRELYASYDQAFAKYWRAKTGQVVDVKQSHGGSGKQAQSVISGLGADVVTLGIASDINAIQKAGDIKPHWEQRLPDNSVPYTSPIVFLVRKGNPKGIRDWDDLIKPGISVITPNPKTSSGGRWNYLAAWGQALLTSGSSQTAARAYVSKLYKNVPVLDSGARGATNTFVQRGIGDVLIGWESDALLVTKKLDKGDFQIVYPSLSIQAEPPVAVVDKFAKRHDIEAVATAYLHYLYSPEGQEIAAQNYYRPHIPAIAKKYGEQFPKLRLFTAENVFGTWDQIQKIHFAQGGTFDQITSANAVQSR